MKRLFLFFALTAAAWGQCKLVLNPVTGKLDCAGPVGPTGPAGTNGTGFIGAGTFAFMSLAIPSVNDTWILTDSADGPGSCRAGGGTSRAMCVWSGTAWVASSGMIAGGSSGQVAFQTGAGKTGFSSGIAYNDTTKYLGLIGGFTAGQSGTGTGTYKINGLTSGTVTLSGADAITDYTFKLPAAAGTTGAPLLYGSPLTYGTVTGNTQAFPTWSGATTAARCVHTDASGNLTISSADCGTGGGASAFTDLTDFKLTLSAPTVTMATGIYRVGSVATVVSSAANCTVSSGAASDTAYFYILISTGSLHVDTTTDVIACTGGPGTFVAGTGSSFPTSDALPIGTWTLTAGVWDSGGYTDYRAAQSISPVITAGTGISVSGSQVAADTAVVPFYSSGSADPAAACADNAVYFQTTAHTFWRCLSNVWSSYGGSGSAQPQAYTVSFDGLGTSLAGGATRCIPISSTGTLQSVRLQSCNGYDANSVCNAGGTATVDIQTVSNASYASTGPSAASSIKGSGSLLSISSAYAADGVLTGWTTSSFGGQTACVVMSSPTAISVDVVMVVQ